MDLTELLYLMPRGQLRRASKLSMFKLTKKVDKEQTQTAYEKWQNEGFHYAREMHKQNKQNNFQLMLKSKFKD